MSPEPTLWERSRQAALTEITTVAMRLILDQGFEQTTIDQIAETSGISRRSFFRYFRTKEDVVLGDLAGQGVLMQEALEAVPLSVGPWEALREAFDAIEALEGDSGTTLKIAKMMYETPSLRSRSIEKHLHWQSLLVPNIRLRLGIQDGQGDPSAEAIVACCIACLDVAGELWTKEGGTSSLADLYDQAVHGMRSAD
ncbi:TetR/AcrR family transcriptional regulator [Paramicrobacterium fandaimingii]|uniref:TetR/AcrR family transcriptional regulator n=1 Tax=Paramicrobacterium fandaimingii TaxID=2708079 RepID=UPI0014220808|nr:TetR/AcrR family transcriptional regulator [Microbacterium fandaimingii]